MPSAGELVLTISTLIGPVPWAPIKFVPLFEISKLTVVLGLVYTTELPREGSEIGAVSPEIRKLRAVSTDAPFVKWVQSTLVPPKLVPCADSKYAAALGNDASGNFRPT